MKQKSMFCGILYDPTDSGSLISSSSAFSKSSLYIWKFSVHVLLKLNMKDFEHNLTSMQNEYNCLDHKKLWKILKEMGIPDHITCLCETCMQVKK